MFNYYVGTSLRLYRIPNKALIQFYKNLCHDVVEIVELKVIRVTSRLIQAQANSI